VVLSSVAHRSPKRPCWSPTAIPGMAGLFESTAHRIPSPPGIKVTLDRSRPGPLRRSGKLVPAPRYARPPPDRLWTQPRKGCPRTQLPFGMFSNRSALALIE